MDMKLCIGTFEDFDIIFGFFLEKAHGFEEKGIDQWTVDYVKTFFNREKLGHYVESGKFYVLKDNEKIVAGGIMSETDNSNIWGCVKDSAFITYLVNNKKGAGRNLIEQLAKLCKSKGLKSLKLDCRDSNTKLKAFYRSCGFKEQGRTLHPRIEGQLSCLFNRQL